MTGRDVPGDWILSGLCAQTDPEAFHPEKGQSSREAKRVCAACDVSAECLRYALEQGIPGGIWGGLGPRERAALRGRRRAA